MARQYAVDDSEWNEVEIINGYAMFMGYLMLGVRGLGLLVVTWTTVVLLGGFVSDLGKKDFWCLTGITLVQTAGVFNFLLKEKLSDMMLSWWGLLATVVATVSSGKKKKDNKGKNEGQEEFEEETESKMKIAFILASIQGLLLGIILCPLGVLYMLGLYISAGVSLWRLIEHDFGDAGGANQKPALQVLYGLAVAQGMLFGYKTIHALGARNSLAKFAAKVAMVDEDLAAEYLEETVAGCEKDPSFATGRNLVTYGVDLMMKAKSNEGFIAGIRVLGGVIKGKDSWPRGPKVLAKHMLTRSDSWSHIIHGLLETMGPRSPYSREVREHAARILALVARGICLQQFPEMIECISSMLDTSEESSNQRDSDLDWKLRQYGDNKLKNYEKIELLERYEVDYLIYEHESQDSPNFSLSGLITRLVQYLPCKTKTMESEIEERERKNTRHGFNRLLTEAVNVIHQLAVDESNRRITSNTILQHKIAMVPLKLHRDNHEACRVSMNSELQMLEKCWVLTEWLVAGVKETDNEAQIPKEGCGACIPPIHLAAPSGEAERSGERIEEEMEEAEKEPLLEEDRGACSPLLQPGAALSEGGRKSREKIEEVEGEEELRLEGRGGCSPSLQLQLAPPSGGGGRKGKYVEEGEEEPLLEGWGACSPALQPEGEKLEGGEEECQLEGWRACSPLKPAAFSGGGGRRSIERIEEDVEDGEVERLLRSMVGSTLGNQIIKNIKSTIKSIFDCLNCRATQKKQAIQILLHLSLDMSFIIDSESRKRRLTWALLLIFRSLNDDSKYWMFSGFTDGKKNVCDFYDIKSLAGKKLANMLQEKHKLPLEESARALSLILLPLGDITSALADDSEDISIRTHATIILEGLCADYNSYSNFAEEVKGILVGVIPKVVKEILSHCAPKGEKREAHATDEEEGFSEYKFLESRMLQDGYMDKDKEQLHKALVSLCRNGYMEKICKERGKSFEYFKSLLV